EMHFVHSNPETGAFGVLAVFIAEEACNEAFAALAHRFSIAAGAEVGLGNAELEVLLPTSTDYSFYEGSLTPPPCSEDVDWMIVRQPLEASAEDIAKFTALYPMNARPIMQPHRRFILSSH